MSMTTRSQQEILDKMKSLEDSKDDIFGFQRGDLAIYLDVQHAKQYSEAINEAEWQTTQKTPAQQIIAYMPFAWEKANNCRGLSASRSIEHMKAWLWLDNNDLADQLDNLYEYYGKPCLVKICEHYKIDWKALDNDAWVNAEGEESISADKALLGHD